MSGSPALLYEEIDSAEMQVRGPKYAAGWAADIAETEVVACLDESGVRLLAARTGELIDQHENAAWSDLSTWLGGYVEQ